MGEGRILGLPHGPSLGILPEADLERLLAAVRDRLGETELEAVPEPVPLLAGRRPEDDLPLDGSTGWLAVAWSAEEVLEGADDARRPGTLSDLEVATRLADALAQVGAVGAAVRPLDVPEPIRPLREAQTLLENTTKHVLLEVPSEAATAEALIEIVRAAAEAPTPERAPASALLPTGLSREERLEAATLLAGAGLPIVLAVEPSLGRDGLAGALTSALAEGLGTAAALRSRSPEARIVLVARALRAGGVPAGSAALRFQMAFVQAAHRLGLPVGVEALATGSRTSDWRAGAEGGLGMTAAWMTGPDLVLGAGLRDGGRAFSPVGLLLDTEAFDLVRPIPLGIAVDEETLAVGVIEKVGPGGHFLGEPHTLRHMRETWTSRFMDRDTWEAWEGKGRPEPPDHARERIPTLLAAHRPSPLPEAVRARIEEVIAERERYRD